MAEKQDPRVIRTRKLITDSFIHLLRTKDFRDITIQHITTAATINRATFYYHFTDKYDLLEHVLKEDILTQIMADVKHTDTLTLQTLKTIFLALIDFQLSITQQCERSYEMFAPKMETLLKKELEKLFASRLAKQWSERQATLGATMLSATLYSLAMDWLRERPTTAERYIDEALALSQQLFIGLD